MVKRPEYIVVGRFGRSHGVAGDICLNPLTDWPEQFEEEGSFWIDSKEGREEIKITAVKYVSGRPVIRIAGVNNPEQARVLSNEYLYKKSLPSEKLPKGTYYHFDLIDCRVIDTANRELGRTTGIEKYPANDVLVIRAPDGREYLLPLVKKFLKMVDIKNKLIIVDPPKGIFDAHDEG
ncbi:MAG: ribosome maturation factor RimM [candidate division Zixibacteria bacterium]|nr:ribosome maturation factor RimM [candidate division Zixibacteria bacterium]